MPTPIRGDRVQESTPQPSSPSTPGTTSQDLARLIAARDWARLRDLAEAQPEAVHALMREQRVAYPGTRWHVAPVLTLFGLLAMRQGERQEAGWAFYYAFLQVGEKDQQPFNESIRRMHYHEHPAWHQPVRGHQVDFVRPQPTHREFLLALLSDEQFTRTFNPYSGPAEQAAQGYIERSFKHSDEIRQLDWVILNKAGEPIGLASIADLVPQSRRGEILIGLASRRLSVLYAWEASLLLMAVAFLHLRLNKLVSHVLGDNQAAQRATLALGFKQEGYQRQHICRPGEDKPSDFFINGLLREDFLQDPLFLSHYQRKLPGVPVARLFEIDGQPRQTAVAPSSQRKTNTDRLAGYFRQVPVYAAGGEDSTAA